MTYSFRWLLMLLALLTLSRVAAAQELAQTLVPPSNSFHGFLGEALSVDQDTLAVGDYNYQWEGHPCQKEHGAIAVYKKANGTWQRSQLLRYLNDTADAPHLGDSVSVRGNVIVASAPYQNVVSGGTTLNMAGSLYVYKRTSATASFTYAGQLTAPSPAANAQFTFWVDPVTNGTYAAATNYNTRPNEIYVYRVQPTLSYLTTLTVPAGSPVMSLFITDQNVLVAVAPDRPAPFAWALNGSQATPIDTSLMAPEGMATTPVLAGNGNTVAWVTQRTNWVGRVLQIATLNASSVVSQRSRELPVEHAQMELKGITLRENQGIFLSLKGQDGSYLITGYKATSSTSGAYNYAGAISQYGLFVSAFAFDGTDLLVGDQFPTQSGNPPCGTGGSVYVYRTNAATSAGPGVSTKLQPWLHKNASNIGRGVARSGSFAVTSSDITFQGGTSLGAVTLFQSVNGVWRQVEQFMDGWTAYYAPGTFSGFGYSVDLSSSFIVVGVPWGVTVQGVQAGGVQTVRQSGGVFPNGPQMFDVIVPWWVETGANFGVSVSVSGNKMAVGAPAWGASYYTSNKRGAVYVYEWVDGDWGNVQELLPGGTSNDYEEFGSSVALSGDNLIVGIPYRNDTRTAVGGVQIFRRNTTTNLFESAAVLGAPSTLPEWSLLGDKVTIGADFAAAAAPSGNTVVTYRRTGSTWVQDRVLTQTQSGFGSAVAVEGTRLVVGAPGQDRVHRFERTNTLASGVWNLTGSLSGSGSFGNAVDLTNGAVTIGAYGATIGATYSGASYVLNFTDIR